jgi:hypothetical protein
MIDGKLLRTLTTGRVRPENGPRGSFARHRRQSALYQMELAQRRPQEASGLHIGRFRVILNHLGGLLQPSGRAPHRESRIKLQNWKWEISQ